MPANWPDLTLAIALALGIAYFVADLAARGLQSVLRAIIADPQVEALFVDRPRRVIRVLIFLITAAALMMPALRLAGYETAVGGDPQAVARWFLDHGIRIALVAITAYMVIRIGSAATRRFEREMSSGTGLDVIERTKRAQTLGRLLQKTLTIVAIGIAALMVLRELGLDITPVLTGAGIVGLAVGFGAQTLVRDIISGFFLILEDQVRVGDVATVNGQGGLVEAINLRTIVLRDYNGVVHVFPNGEIKTLANMTKDFSYFVLDVSVRREEDIDRVIAVLREIAGTLLEDPVYRAHVLEPLEIAGVEAFAANQVTIRARIKTVPLKQWDVGRELRRRILRGFSERGIDIPLPQQAVWIQQPGLPERAGPPGEPDSSSPEPPGPAAAGR